MSIGSINMIIATYEYRVEKHEPRANAWLTFMSTWFRDVCLGLLFHANRLKSRTVRYGLTVSTVLSGISSILVPCRQA